MNKQEEKKHSLPHSFTQFKEMFNQLKDEFQTLSRSDIASSLANGNTIEQAREVLAVRLTTKNKQSSSQRVASYGLPVIKVSKNLAVAFVLRCESDFNRNSSSFTNAAEQITQHLFDSNGQVTSVITEIVSNLASQTRENVSLTNVSFVIKDDHQYFAVYHHMNKLSSLVVVNGKQELAYKMAAQVCFSEPSYISREQIPTSLLNEQANSIRTSVEQENVGKKPEIIEKIVKNKLASWLSQQCLLTANYYESEGSPQGLITVEQFLAKNSSEVKKFILLIV